MNYFGGGDAAPPVGVKGSSGHGRGGVKLNAPAPIAASSLTAPLQQQRPVAMELAPRDCGPHCNALPQLDAGDEWRQRSETPRDSQLQKVRPRPESSTHLQLSACQHGFYAGRDMIQTPIQLQRRCPDLQVAVLFLGSCIRLISFAPR